MLEDITMPSLGADMTDGTLNEWLVKEGDKVDVGDIIAVLETQKGAIDMEVYSAGTITEILVAPVAKVSVGTVLARLALTDTSSQAPLKKERTETLTTELKTSDVTKEGISQEVNTQDTHSQHDNSQEAGVNILTAQVESVQAEAMQTSRVLASPIVRRLAKEQQLDLAGIKGSGPQGAILLADLNAFLANDEHENISKTASSEQNMRQAIAAAMAKSKQEIPHFYISLAIDISAAQQWLQRHNKNKSPDERVLLLALLLKALAKSLLKYPQLNGFYQDASLPSSVFQGDVSQGEGFKQASAIHIGNVISLRQGGLLVPAIHDVDKLSVQEIMESLRDITQRSRTGHLRTSELTDASITVTNMGERGADSVFGVIYPPQVAILGFGKNKKELILANDKVTEVDKITACLSADHRVIDGMIAAKFLNYLSKQLQQPERL